MHLNLPKIKLQTSRTIPIPQTTEQNIIQAQKLDAKKQPKWLEPAVSLPKFHVGGKKRAALPITRISRGTRPRDRESSTRSGASPQLSRDEKRDTMRVVQGIVPRASLEGKSPPGRSGSKESGAIRTRRDSDFDRISQALDHDDAEEMKFPRSSVRSSPLAPPTAITPSAFLD